MIEEGEEIEAECKDTEEEVKMAKGADDIPVSAVCQTNWSSLK